MRFALQSQGQAGTSDWVTASAAVSEPMTFTFAAEGLIADAVRLDPEALAETSVAVVFRPISDD